jgi:integrase
MSVRKRQWKTAKGETKEAWIVDYVDGQGDRIQETFERKKDADAYHDQVKVDVRKGTHIAPSKSPTMAEAAERWINEIDGRGVERTTLSAYKEHVRLHILPLIKDNTKLSALSPASVEAFRDKLLKKLSRPMARKVLISFKSILKANRYQHVAAGVSIGSDKRKRRLEAGRDFPTTSEVSRLLNAAKGDMKWRAFLLVVCFCGLRSSELRGLRWSDVDLKSCELHVRQRVDHYGKVGAPKSDTSVRTIPLDRDVMIPALMAWKIKCPPSDFVFPSSTGHSEHPASIMRGLTPYMAAAAVARTDEDGEPRHKYGLHTFRHFFASWCINPKTRGGRELPPKEVQGLLGHSSIMMTMDTYGHLFAAKSDRAELSAAVRELVG